MTKFTPIDNFNAKEQAFGYVNGWFVDYRMEGGKLAFSLTMEPENERPNGLGRRATEKQALEAVQAWIAKNPPSGPGEPPNTCDEIIGSLK